MTQTLVVSACDECGLKHRSSYSEHYNVSCPRTRSASRRERERERERAREREGRRERESEESLSPSPWHELAFLGWLARVLLAPPAVEHLLRHSAPARGFIKAIHPRAPWICLAWTSLTLT